MNFTDDDIRYFEELNTKEQARALEWLPRERGNEGKTLEIQKRARNIPIDSDIGPCDRCGTVGKLQCHHTFGWPQSKFNEFELLGIDNCDCHITADYELEMAVSKFKEFFNSLRETESYKNTARVSLDDVQQAMDKFPNKKLIENTSSTILFNNFRKSEGRRNVRSPVKKAAVIVDRKTVSTVLEFNGLVVKNPSNELVIEVVDRLLKSK